jgi:hypothetical protein
MSKVCKYGCGVELGQFNTRENKFLESDQKTLHTKERCQELKQNSVPNNGNEELSVSVLLKRLDQLGIKIDLERLRNI